MKALVRLMPVTFACFATLAFAGDPPAKAADQPAKPAATSPSADTPAPAIPADPAAAPNAASTPSSATPAASASATPPAGSQASSETPQRVVLEDKTLSNDQVRQILAEGYKPQKGRGGDVLYCRSEALLGSHFEKKVCMTADQIKATTLQSRNATERAQQGLYNNPISR